ncbi:hypothetical protein SmphiM6_60 [Sinorhizobium phage phiM6]|nr:hypothetical protein SmphiM6_60 [Sinorhizobium phage phiM6]
MTSLYDKRRNKTIATSWYNIKCKIKWAKVYEPDEYAGAKRYMVNAYPVDGAEWEKVQKSGVQLQTKEDTDGKYITLRRPVSKVIKDDLVIFCPPEITGAVEVHYVGKDGQKVRSYTKGDNTAERVGDPVVLANGTLAIVNFCAYDTKQGRGSRLESLKILDLVSMDDIKEQKVSEEDTAEEEVVVSNEEKGDDIPW